MGFEQNIKSLRKQRGLSQEEFAEQLEVSRQAVSKWEQGAGYPETEKLLLLAKQFHVSLDALMADGEPALPQEPGRVNQAAAAGRIRIASFEGKDVIGCYKVSSSFMFKAKPDEPKYALFGVDGSSAWGENTVVLGWYDEEDKVKQEIGAIMAAMDRGDASYTLRYAAPVKRQGFKIKLAP